MYSILTVTTAASSYDLTSLSNVKAELGVSDGSKDALLQRYITSASAAAAQYCNRVFQVEAVSERFLNDYDERFNRMRRRGVGALQLERWPLTTVTSVTEDSVLLVEGTDYLVDKALGALTRLDQFGFPCSWAPLPLTVAYSAGFSTIPADVEDAVIRMIVRRHLAAGRDPNLRQENIPGVIERSWWIASGTQLGNMSPDILDLLDNYRLPIVR